MKNIDIQEELKNMSQAVASNIQPERNWNIPEGYFSDSENILMKQFRLSEDISVGSPAIPEGYFEQNENKIIRKIQPAGYRIKILIRVAASVSILLAALYWWNYNHQYKPEDTELAWLYLDDNMHEFEAEDFIDYQLMDEETITSLPTWELLSRDSLSAEDFLQDAGDFFESETDDFF